MHYQGRRIDHVILKLLKERILMVRYFFVALLINLGQIFLVIMVIKEIRILHFSDFIIKVLVFSEQTTAPQYKHFFSSLQSFYVLFLSDLKTFCCTCISQNWDKKPLLVNSCRHGWWTITSFSSSPSLQPQASLLLFPRLPKPNHPPGGVCQAACCWVTKEDCGSEKLSVEYQQWLLSRLVRIWSCQRLHEFT